MSRILITGGLGVIGSSIAANLLRDGHTVSIIDAAEEKRNDWAATELTNMFIGSRLTILKERLERTNHLQHFLRQADYVLHAAAHTGIPHSAADPHDDWVSNVDATRSLLEAMRTLGQAPPPMVALSSVKPYRVHDLSVIEDPTRFVWTEARAGIDETYPLEPDEPYAASKMAQSALCMAYARSFDLPITVVRCSNLYGAAPCHGPRHGWLTWFCISAAIGRTVEVQGTGKQVRDMLWADDVQSAFNAAIEHIDVTRGQVYNIGGGLFNSISVLEAVDRIRIEMPLVTKPAPGRLHEDPIFITDFRKFTKDTGWIPKVGVAEGVHRLCDWAIDNTKILNDLYDGVTY